MMSRTRIDVRSRVVTASVPNGLSLAPMRALRPAADPERLGRLLCPPYDVIDARTRDRLLAGDPDNAVAVILPDPTPAGYEAAAERLAQWVAAGLFTVDDDAALYIYEMRTAGGAATRGLLGAVELRDPSDGVILPHENTMAGPVADRLAVMTATGTDLEPIYLVYDGGGPASGCVKNADAQPPVAQATTSDGTTHRLWAIRDPEVLRAIDEDLATRRALIADGHHRYATYRERQRLLRESDGPGPWDRGLALLVDSSEYGPQVHAIHRVVTGLSLADALARMPTGSSRAVAATELEAALIDAEQVDGFAAVLTDGRQAVLVTDPEGALTRAAARSGDLAALTELDVTIVHRGLIETMWNLPDTEDVVGYAHSVEDAVEAAHANDGFAILLRPTPVAAVAAVAAAGARMPRKSTLFTPKPASGLVMRRLVDQPADRPAAGS
jgi:uncharacterized protein (DUF1015 family)